MLFIDIKAFSCENYGLMRRINPYGRAISVDEERSR